MTRILCFRLCELKEKVISEVTHLEDNKYCFFFGLENKTPFGS